MTQQTIRFLLMTLALGGACASEEADDPASPDGGIVDNSDAGPDVDAGQTSATCTPPALLLLADIPDNPTLNDTNPDTVAIFEVEGHKLIGKHVDDVAAAEGGLKLWQEITLRIPENQLLDLVQFEISTDTDPTAYFNRNGNVTTTRLGLKIGYSTNNFATNDPDPCAPLVPRRGSFDWSLVHEFGHLRGFLDQSWPLFLTAYGNIQGPGEGYPADGSPVLDRDFVTSYAERDDGDEDYAETFTTYVMLADSEIPAVSANEALALQKLRWVASQPGLSELRKALRISEPGGGNANVSPLARLADVHPNFGGGGGEPIPDNLAIPSFIQGTWRESATDGWQFEFRPDDIISTFLVDGVETNRVSVKELLDSDMLTLFEVVRETNNQFQFIFETIADVLTGDNFELIEPTELVFVRDGAVEYAVLFKVP